jgi:hypothetical protein
MALKCIKCGEWDVYFVESTFQLECLNCGDVIAKLEKHEVRYSWLDVTGLMNNIAGRAQLTKFVDTGNDILEDCVPDADAQLSLVYRDSTWWLTIRGDP